MAKPNFVFPVRELESERVLLTIFIDEHVEEFYESIKNHQDALFKYFPPGPFDSVEHFRKAFLEDAIRKDPARVVFAVFDKTGGNLRLAGMAGLLSTDVENQCTEIGFIMTLPAFQRTHVTTNAVGLLLHYCLEMPTADGIQQKYGPGLGLRRVQWQCHAENTPSRRHAERIGMKLEGVIRWQRVLEAGKVGHEVPEDRKRLCAKVGRHSYMLAMCWDDWEVEGGREHVQALMARTPSELESH